MDEPDDTLNGLARAVVDAAFQVHKALGPGLLESVYEQCLAIELSERQLKTDRQRMLPVEYKGHRIQQGFRLDLIVADALIVEVKACEHLLPIHEAQLLTYLRMTGCRIGLLINFNTTLIKNGIRRLIA